MLDRVLSHIRTNVVAYLALFLALGGTSYAVTQIDRNSVFTRHIVNGEVRTPDLGNQAVTELKLDGFSNFVLRSDIYRMSATTDGNCASTTGSEEVCGRTLICNRSPGDIVIGGGVRGVFRPSNLASAAPFEDDRWIAQWENQDSANRPQVTVWAICAGSH